MPEYSIDQYAYQLEVNAITRRGLFILRSAGTVRGWVSFFDDGASIAAPSLDANQRISLNLPLSRYPAVMDLLRNEKPVKLYYHSPSIAGLSVGGEPVGEHEL